MDPDQVHLLESLARREAAFRDPELLPTLDLRKLRRDFGDAVVTEALRRIAAADHDEPIRRPLGLLLAVCREVQEQNAAAMGGEA
jgi:hypothetical protein